MHLICGMHRSGTSLVAKLFHDAGADMGDQATLHPADKWNPTGYYEQREIIALNISLLHGAWGKLASYMWFPSTATILSRAKRHSARIAQYGRMYGERIVKENRFCLTLPAWRANGGDVRRVLICLREPASVASSLRLRNKVPLWYAYRMWHAHLSRLLENCDGLDVWFVRYENLLGSGSGVAEAMSALAFLGVDLPESGVAALLDGTIEGRRRNAAASRAIEYPRHVRALWSELQRRHAKQRLS